MAIVNTQTGKIIGCKKGSLTWWHEKAHIIYNNSDQGMKNSFWAECFFYITPAFIILYLLFHNIFYAISMVISYMFFLGFLIYEELWCWSYARRKKRR